MKVEEIKLLLPWYVNDTLAADEKRAVREHLRDCAECCDAVADLRRIAAAVEQEQAVPLVPEAPVEGFLDKAIAQKQAVDTSHRMRQFALAASVLVLVAVGYLGINALPEANVFRTVTDPSRSAEIVYVFDVSAEETADEALRSVIAEMFSDSQIAESEKGYRLTFAMPSASLKELDKLADELRRIDGVRQVDIVGVQLPLE